MKTRMKAGALRQAVNDVLVELHGAEDAGVEAIMGREVVRSQQYHTEELDALTSWSGESLVRAAMPWRALRSLCALSESGLPIALALADSKRIHAQACALLC